MLMFLMHQIQVQRSLCMCFRLVVSHIRITLNNGITVKSETKGIVLLKHKNKGKMRKIFFQFFYIYKVAKKN